MRNYLDKMRVPTDDCVFLKCNTNTNELTSFPIMSNESFTFDYSDKHGVELGLRQDDKGLHIDYKS